MKPLSALSEQELTQILQSSPPEEEKKENRVRTAVDRLVAGEGVVPQAAGMALGGAKFLKNIELVPHQFQHVQ